MTYWKSTDLGSTWTKQTQPIIVINGTSSFSVGDGSCYIDEIRIMPNHARMMTYTYELGLGKLTEMDHDGRVIHYQYDEKGRLYRILDDEGNPLKAYEYHYANE